MRYLISAGILALVMCFAFQAPHPVTIRGIVLDAQSGKPIRGASIMINGSKSGTRAAVDGHFALKVSTLPVQLIFSAMGYKVRELKIKDSSISVTIKLQPSSAALIENVVIGDDEPEVSFDHPKKDYLDKALAGRASGLSTPMPSPAVRDKLYETQPNNPAQDHFGSGQYDSTQTFNREGYDELPENPYLKATDNPLSTFSIDVDGASYSNVRRFLQNGQLPPAGSVRIEELVNYFHYNYPQPTGDDPFSINTEMAACPWNKQNKLLMIGLQGKKIPVEKLPPSNLVFLIDVSGSMMEPDKLPLVQESLRMLVDQLREQDRVSLVVYAGNAGLVMPSTSGMEKQKLKAAIDQLEAGGSTAGGQGIQLAYEVAKKNFQKNGNNRVILCTDGDFNVGVSSDAALESLIEKERTSGVFLTVLGFGTGNYQDSKMEKLADKGNGNHAYIDNINEAKKVLVNEFGGTLFTIAKDVKLQVEFNPANVKAYRLIGYENRLLAKEDFNNDKKDAGELGSGHTVTAIYEIVPSGISSPFLESTDPLKYQQLPGISTANAKELVNIKFRYKKPDGDTSSLMVHTVLDEPLAVNATSDNFRFVSAVAQFGMLLRHSTFSESSSFRQALSLAKGSLGNDEAGYRKEFISLVSKAMTLHKTGDRSNGEDDLGRNY